jgi:hypothetical protein
MVSGKDIIIHKVRKRVACPPEAGFGQTVNQVEAVLDAITARLSFPLDQVDF